MAAAPPSSRVASAPTTASTKPLSAPSICGDQVGYITTARILVDNFAIDELEKAVATNRGYGYAAAELEASGNVTIDTIRAIAETGVDYISTGAITKNIQAVDLSMLFRID